MPDRSSKQRPDFNEIAARVLREATDESIPREKPPEKDPAAVALGRKGGLKGGKARAAKLSPEQRREIAHKAAVSRWQSDKARSGA